MCSGLQVPIGVALWLLMSGHAALASPAPAASAWPDADQWLRVLRLQDYNTQVVLLGTVLLGTAAGAVGSFTLLRRRALMGDALSHATLPGVVAAFLLAPLVGVESRSLPFLLLGATISGVAGVVSILFIRNLTPLREDAALSIVLSVFFGAGVVLLRIAETRPEGNKAGLETFIFGKTASMIAGDAWLIAAAGAIAVLVLMLLMKEVTLLCFDEGFARARGFPVVVLDVILMSLVVLVSIVGLQAVGMVLMIAMLVIPAAAARFWTHRLQHTVRMSAAIGGISGFVGALVSALFQNLPSGAMIVLVAGALFVLSMLIGTERGIIVRGLRRVALNRSVDRQHLLRGLFEAVESRGIPRPPQGGLHVSIPFDELLGLRSWNAARLRRQIRRCAATGDVQWLQDRTVRLTAAGFEEAARLAHEHRLWELYLITHADVAPARVDRDADAIEHVLEPVMIRELELLLQRTRDADGIVESPHPIEATAELSPGNESNTTGMPGQDPTASRPDSHVSNEAG